MKRPETGGEALRFSLSLRSDHQIGGHVFDPVDPDRRFVVELLIDGYPAALARAELFDPDLAGDGHGDGCYGFVFSIDAAALQTAHVIEVRLANGARWARRWTCRRWRSRAPGPRQGRRLARRLALSGPPRQGGNCPRADRWADPCGNPSFALDPYRRRARSEAGARLRPDFARRFADGCAHFVQILDQEGRELSGSPCAFVAFDDSLARFLDERADLQSERLRAETFDGLFPRSLPFSQFAEWRQTFPLAATETKKGAFPKIAVALVGEREVEASVASLEMQQGCDWVAAALAGGDGETAFPNAALREFLGGEARACEAVVFAPSGTLFQPQALALLAQALKRFPAAPSAYCDFTVAADDGGEWPVALSAFDYERMLEQGCGALVFGLRMDSAKTGGDEGRRQSLSPVQLRSGRAPRARAPAFGLPGRRRRPSTRRVFLPGCRVSISPSSGATWQAPTEAHLRARGVPAKIEAGFGALLPAVRMRRPAPRGKVSFLVPTRDRVDLLKPCVETLFATVDFGRHELIVLDNDSSDPETLAWLEQMANKGVRRSSGSAGHSIFPSSSTRAPPLAVRRIPPVPEQ